MKIAIVGAGFSGLAACYFLSPRCKVVLFDAQGIGKGASGVSSGLLHPYPAADGKRSFKADIALHEAKSLLNELQQLSNLPLFSEEGILRQTLTEEQCLRFKSHIENHKDVEQCGENLFLIRSALTVYVSRYLETLWRACEQRGATLEIRKIASLEELTGFDQVILAAGWGMKDFKEADHLQMHYVKGQKLICKTKKKEKMQSLMGKKYLAKMEEEGEFEIGSTYERGFTTDLPEMESALRELQEAVEEFASGADVLECRAGVRVINSFGYLPIAKKLSSKCTVLTGMGSRGLLYHAYYGKMVAQSILEGVANE